MFIRRLIAFANLFFLVFGVAGIYVKEIKYAATVALTISFILSLSNTGIYEKLIKDLNSSLEKLSVEANMFSDENKKLSMSIDKLKETNLGLLKIQEQSQSLLTSLMSSGDKFNDFGKILEETTKKNLTLTEKLTLLVNKLSEEEFNKVDINGDGIITKEEMKTYFSSRN